jgi:hypothetical protein
MKPYLIRTPPYDATSGGIKVMYGLYGWLLSRGIPAFLNAQIDVPSIGIYPEIYHGNDMFASKVIRYVLQTPGIMGTSDETGEFKTGPVSFDPKDEIYVFSKVYDQWGVDSKHILFLPIIDLHTFVDQKKKRTKTAFYVGKGFNQGKHPQDAIKLTKEFAKDQQKLADFLNECQVLYVYDRLTAMMEVARLCGCRIKYFGELTKDQLSLYEPGMNGVGYRDQDILLEVKGFRTHYIGLRGQFGLKLDDFIRNTQK